MPHYVGLDVSQKTTAICVVNAEGRRIWRGVSSTTPEGIERAVRKYAGDDVRIGIETGPMTPWLFHRLRERELDLVCLDARHARALLKMQINKTDQNDAEGLAQVMRMGWYRAVHVKSFETHRARALLGARAQLVGMTTRLSNHIRGVLKTFGLLPGAMRGMRFDRRVEVLISDRPDVAPIVQPMLSAWRELRKQIDAFDKAIHVLVMPQPDLPAAHERTRYRRAVGAGVCQHDRGAAALPTIAVNRSTPRANASQVPVWRDRPQRAHITMRRRTCENAPVRGCRCDPD